MALMFISVEAVKWVMNESASERSARLVFIAIAAHCNDDGYAWPAVDTICEYTKLSKPVVLESIQKLNELKELTVEKGGRGPGDTNHYYLSAFMASRVKKGKENPDKGKVSVEKGSTRVDTNKNLEKEILEEAIPLRSWDEILEGIAKKDREARERCKAGIVL